MLNNQLVRKHVLKFKELFTPFAINIICTTFLKNRNFARLLMVAPKVGGREIMSGFALFPEEDFFVADVGAYCVYIHCK
jgi:hypothetical protein